MWLWILIDRSFSYPFWVHNMSVNVRAWTREEGQWNLGFKDYIDHVFWSLHYCVEHTDIERNLMIQSQ